jgi:hypothetical protein
VGLFLLLAPLQSLAGSRRIPIFAMGVRVYLLMNYIFWVPLIVNVIGVYLNYRQVKLVGAQFGAKPLPQLASIKSIRRYWPLMAMTALMFACWVPYFLTSAPVTERFIAYGHNPRSIYTTLKTSDLVYRRPDRLMLIDRTWNGAVPEESYRDTVRSATFEIGEDFTSLQINLTPEQDSRIFTIRSD